MGFFIVPNVGSRVREVRKKAGLSQEQLADIVGASQQTIAKIESSQEGKSSYIRDIAKALGVSLDWIMDGVVNAQSDDATQNVDEFIDNATAALTDAINSMRAINIQQGKSPDEFNPVLLKRAFGVSLRGKLTGDYVTAALGLQDLKKAT
ncbi:helix-turn-helix domain-containing protein [Aestuariibacter halophilus]|uniref:Helix-turn-helix domain-containing protein n=1 Tax=Fluctibacter halophilus TaxID=226011 RepID=A0ABS8G9S0_9ALTE|nr:helix-turn-helix transcriptional regulator [Aestuariibacter halophilus]MCC2615961.1 helix-turn-helix domain-containing protein [Aestuariibacter halophilus]